MQPPKKKGPPPPAQGPPPQQGPGALGQALGGVPPPGMPGMGGPQSPGMGSFQQLDPMLGDQGMMGMMGGMPAQGGGPPPGMGGDPNPGDLGPILQMIEQMQAQGMPIEQIMAMLGIGGGMGQDPSMSLMGAAPAGGMSGIGAGGPRGGGMM